ncbi:MAG: hypothetical protein HC810_06935 [Acaryochloridaceae cyanobacterium RL_2_7]|nr:hypothetical protein [Acaryochloridaceae cyanobacterium RL_2_7]
METKTSWAQWQGLKKVLAENLPTVEEHHKFDHFAEHAVEQIEVLAKIESHIHIIRRHESYWDQAFHLYSSLHYLRG